MFDGINWTDSHIAALLFDGEIDWSQEFSMLFDQSEILASSNNLFTDDGATLSSDGQTDENFCGAPPTVKNLNFDDNIDPFVAISSSTVSVNIPNAEHKVVDNNDSVDWSQEYNLLLADESAKNVSTDDDLDWSKEYERLFGTTLLDVENKENCSADENRENQVRRQLRFD